MYLPETANRATLRFIRASAAAGSAVVYAYSLGASLQPDGGGLYGARSTVAEVARRGEPHIMGWTLDLPVVLAKRPRCSYRLCSTTHSCRRPGAG